LQSKFYYFCKFKFFADYLEFLFFNKNKVLIKQKYQNIQVLIFNLRQSIFFFIYFFFFLGLPTGMQKAQKPTKKRKNSVCCIHQRICFFDRIMRKTRRTKKNWKDERNWIINLFFSIFYNLLKNKILMTHFVTYYTWSLLMVLNVRDILVWTEKKWLKKKIT
jgi:hypothetical protein